MRSSSTRSVVVLLSILLNIHLFGVQAERKVKLHKLEKFKEDTRFVETNISFVEVEENVVKVNGELKVIYQVDDHFEIDVEVNRSEERDGEYKSVFYVDKTGVCDFMKTYYKDFFYDRLKEYSNAPDPSTCPLPEGAHYHLDDYPLDVEMLKTLLKPGHYRIELKAMLDHLFYPLIYKAELEVFE